MTFRIELRRDHRVERFDCGKEPLNRFLVRFALQSQQTVLLKDVRALIGR